jgi:hypothetical protein
MGIRKIGVWILAILPVLGLAIWKGQEFLGLELPQQIDVLAGVATVYALVFLILGYIQQGKELAQNTEALRLQTEELRSSVEQSEELVKVTREQFELDQKARQEEDVRRKIMYQPSFVITEVKPFIRKLRTVGTTEGSGINVSVLSVRVINEGAQANNVKFALDEPRRTHPHTVSKFDSGQEVNVELQFNSFDSTELQKTVLTITYRTLLGDIGAEYFTFGNTIGGTHIQCIKYDQYPEPHG